MKYDAFISYRHADLDLYIAKKVHKALETFKVPKAVAKKTGKKNIKRVFRDQEELPIGSDLGDNIESALSRSEYLLVICSPRTPESYWVQKEIDTFIGIHGKDKVLAVLIEGEPNEAFPPQLLTDDEGNPVEPLAADVRGATKGERNRKMKTEIMRLAAPLLGCSYDDLKQRHRERKMKRMAAMAAAVAVFALAFGAYHAYNAALIQENYEGKQRNQSKYLAETSLSLLQNGDRRAAVLVALEALPSEKNDRPYVAEAQYALSEALYVYDTGINMKPDRILSHTLPVNDFCYDEEGTRVVSVDQGSNVYVWDLTDGKQLARISPGIDEDGYIRDVRKAVLCEEGILICEDKALRCVNFDNEELWQISRDSTVGCFYNERTQTMVCMNNEEVCFYDGKTGELLMQMTNELPYSYTDTIIFNQDDTQMAIAHLNTEESVPEGYVSIYDIKSGKINTVTTATSYISDMDFDKDGNLLVITNTFGDGFESSNVMGTDCIQKIDPDTGKTLWSDTFPYQKAGINAVSSQIICRYYEDEAGVVHDEILASVDNKAYSWQNKTGQRIAEVTVDGGIMNFMAAAKASYGYLAQNNGRLEIVSMEDGSKYEASTVETGKQLTKAEIRNYSMVVSAYGSPDLSVFKYPDYSDAEVVETLENTISDMEISPNETYYAVRVYDYDAANNVSFYRADTNEKVSQWVEAESYYVLSGFIDDETYMLVTGNDEILFYDIASGEKNIMSIDSRGLATNYCLNEDHSLLMICHGYGYEVIDLKKREVLISKETEEYLSDMILSKDGKKAYCKCEGTGLCMLDTESGVLTPIDLEGHQVLQCFDSEEAYAVSSDGRLLAVSCSDNMLRVIEVQKEEILAEIPFTGIRRQFIQFSDDGSRIILQGDDYYLRVFDLNQQKFTFISAVQYNEIKKSITDKESNTLCLITSADMVILNQQDYERVAQIEGGEMFLPDKGKLYSSDYRTLYQFPYMTLEMLLQEAAEQFEGETLSELEKVRFHVD